jgi:hypothetical protein
MSADTGDGRRDHDPSLDNQRAAAPPRATTALATADTAWTPF